MTWGHRPYDDGEDERRRSDARDPVTEPSIVLGGVVPIGAAVLLSLAVGIRNLTLLAALLAGALAVTAGSGWLIQQRAEGQRPRASGTGYEVAFALIAPVLTTLYGLAVLERPVVAFGLVIVLPFAATSYVLPKHLRLPLQGYAMAVWTAGLVVVAADLVVIVGHVAGGVALALVSNGIADRQRARRVRERETRKRAEALMQLLTSVQQVNSLEPRAVLHAVVDGLRRLGLADAEVRQIDEGAGVARLVAGETDLDAGIEAEVPLDLPLVRESLEDTGPVVIADVGRDPRVTRRIGYRSGALLGLSLGDGRRGLLSVGSVDGPVTPSSSMRCSCWPSTPLGRWSARASTRRTCVSWRISVGWTCASRTS